jgi:hypothetical protein
VAGKVSTVETTLAQLAGRSHGVVTRAQLLAAGITRDEIDHRLSLGALLREHPGVYRVGHRAPSVEARYLAAVWACGDSAVLSGRAASYLWGILKGAAPAPEVTAHTERRVPGVTTHRARRIERTTHRGIPITTVPRTLVDLASDLSLDALARACHEAGVKYDTTPAQIEAVLAKRRRTRGAAKLRAVTSGDVQALLSELERSFQRRLKEAGLPLPQTNRPAGGRRVDCRWPDRRLTVELEARARGDEFRRYTYGDVVESPRLMLAELRPLLR